MDCKGIIFDLDGTLLNTLNTLANSFNRALSLLNYPPHPVEAYKQFIGDGARNAVKRCLPESERNSETIERCLSLQRKEYAGCWQDGTFPYQDIPELLECIGAKNLKLGVLSNKDDPFAHQCVNHFFPGIFGENIQGHSNKIPLKPDPSGALMIAQKMATAPSQTLIVGDSSMDVNTAHASHMIAVGVTWGFRKVEELKQAGAKIILDDPLQLLDALDETWI